MFSTPVSPHFLNIMQVFVLLSVHRFYYKVFMCVFCVCVLSFFFSISNNKWIVSFHINSIYCSISPKILFFFFFCNSLI